MKVLVSDNLGEVGVQILKSEEGIEVDVKTGLKPDELKAIIGDYDGLAIRSATKVTEDILQAAKKLKVVGRAGIGLDNVDIPAATKRGIVVMNTPGGNVVTTAEHSIALLMALTRKIPQGTATLRAGKWEKKKLEGREIFNKTLGVIGYGNIGSIVADRARGLKMRVIIYDPHVLPERIEKDGFECVSLDELYKQSDYISIHVPKLKNTLGMINKDAFSKMKDGVMLINCARGGLVNEADLYEALKSKKVSGAALDVFAEEPPGQSPLFEFDTVIGTPHLGASTYEAQTNVAVDVAKQIVAFLKHNTIINAVNVPSVTGEALTKLQPFIFLADRIGSLQAQLKQGAIKEVHIEYAGDFMGLDLNPITTALLQGMLKPIVSDSVNSVNAPIIAKEMGIKVSEITSSDSQVFNHLITVKVIAQESTNMICGTIFGKNDPRIVRINHFRLEVIPKGHLALIQNMDKPGAIGSIGSLLGQHHINIARMTVGQEEEGERNIIFLTTDTSIPNDTYEALIALPLVKSVIRLEL
ncbi:MAG: phosphoglycerate dehydrogenase [Desulfobacterales bacterium]|nr:phosphoglycerate dehydrogenase [Desulfobacterales bacterium]